MSRAVLQGLVVGQEGKNIAIKRGEKQTPGPTFFSSKRPFASANKGRHYESSEKRKG